MTMRIEIAPNLKKIIITLMTTRIQMINRITLITMRMSLLLILYLSNTDDNGNRDCSYNNNKLINNTDDNGSRDCS